MQIKDLLKCRFGHQYQEERFIAELQARRRRPGETLQSLYDDLQRLMALAYSSEHTNLIDLIGRDAFVNALNDEPLRKYNLG